MMERLDPEQPGLVAVHVSREDVERGDIEGTLGMLATFFTREGMMSYRQQLTLSVSGYDHDPRELYDVPEFCRFIRALDAKWPYWAFFFRTRRPTTLPTILLALAGATSGGRGQASVSPDALRTVVMDKVAQMNGICTWLGDSEAVINEMTDEVLAALMGGQR
jgi:hypothetical protein